LRRLRVDLNAASPVETSAKLLIGCRRHELPDQYTSAPSGMTAANSRSAPDVRHRTMGILERLDSVKGQKGKGGASGGASQGRNPTRRSDSVTSCV
jgi:hypothetical protein